MRARFFCKFTLKHGTHESLRFSVSYQNPLFNSDALVITEETAIPRALAIQHTTQSLLKSLDRITRLGAQKHNHRQGPSGSETLHKIICAPPFQCSSFSPSLTFQPLPLLAVLPTFAGDLSRALLTLATVYKHVSPRLAAEIIIVVRYRPDFDVDLCRVLGHLPVTTAAYCRKRIPDPYQ